MNGKGENKGVVYCEMQVRDSDIVEEAKHKSIFNKTKSPPKTHAPLLLLNSIFRGEKIVKGV